jgi:hypothetical protein
LPVPLRASDALHAHGAILPCSARHSSPDAYEKTDHRLTDLAEKMINQQAAAPAAGK